jgi:hypothetical protein
MEQPMTDGQYRALVAYLNYWTPTLPEFGMAQALTDIGIIDSLDDVVAELAKAGHDFNAETGLLYDRHSGRPTGGPDL